MWAACQSPVEIQVSEIRFCIGQYHTLDLLSTGRRCATRACSHSSPFVFLKIAFRLGPTWLGGSRPGADPSLTIRGAYCKASVSEPGFLMISFVRFSLGVLRSSGLEPKSSDSAKSILVSGRSQFRTKSAPRLPACPGAVPKQRPRERAITKELISHGPRTRLPHP